ncbi:MAG: HAD family phosphatase [Mailhella sp.]|nr:HAD family phosphatase [Mailhella sp.]
MSAIVFDMDGVLIDSERLVLKAWRHVGDELGLPDLSGILHKALGTTHAHTATLFADAFGRDFDYLGFRDRVRAYFYDVLTVNGAPLKAGVTELLFWLKSEGWRIGLASSTREAGVRLNMERTGLISYFDVLIGGDMLKASKPAPDIYLMACARLGAAPHTAYAVEDSYNGIRSAHAAGMHALMVPDMVPADEEMRTLARAVLPDLLAVRDWLVKQEQNA